LLRREKEREIVFSPDIWVLIRDFNNTF